MWVVVRWCSPGSVYQFSYLCFGGGCGQIGSCPGAVIAWCLVLPCLIAYLVSLLSRFLVLSVSRDYLQAVCLITIGALVHLSILSYTPLCFMLLLCFTVHDPSALLVSSLRLV